MSKQITVDFEVWARGYKFFSGETKMYFAKSGKSVDCQDKLMLAHA